MIERPEDVLERRAGVALLLPLRSEQVADREVGEVLDDRGARSQRLLGDVPVRRPRAELAELTDELLVVLGRQVAEAPERRPPRREVRRPIEPRRLDHRGDSVVALALPEPEE